MPCDDHHECICFDLKIGNKRCTTVSLYRSPSQSTNEFENNSHKLNLTMESITQKNPFLTQLLLAILMPGHQNVGWMIRQVKKVLKSKTCSLNIPFNSLH